MMFLTKRTRVIIIGAIILGVSLVATVNFSGLCQLEAVTLNGQLVPDWIGPYAILQPGSVARQPLSELADSLLERDDVYCVDVNLSSPHTIGVVTNCFTPRALLLDKPTGTLFGLDEHARVLPLCNAELNWECPVITGLEAGQRFAIVSDQGVVELLRQLKELEDSHRDLYRLIEEIHFAKDGSVRVAISGLSFVLMVYPDQLAHRLDRFTTFYTQFDADLSKAELIDLRYDQMVIVREER